MKWRAIFASVLICIAFFGVVSCENKTASIQDTANAINKDIVLVLLTEKQVEKYGFVDKVGFPLDIPITGKGKNQSNIVMVPLTEKQIKEQGIVGTKEDPWWTLGNATKNKTKVYVSLAEEQANEYGISTPWFTFDILALGNATEKNEMVVLKPLSQKQAGEYGLCTRCFTSDYGSEAGNGTTVYLPIMQAYKRGIIAPWSEIDIGKLGNQTNNTILVPVSKSDAEEYTCVPVPPPWILYCY